MGIGSIERHKRVSSTIVTNPGLAPEPQDDPRITHNHYYPLDREELNRRGSDVSDNEVPVAFTPDDLEQLNTQTGNRWSRTTHLQGMLNKNRWKERHFYQEDGEVGPQQVYVFSSRTPGDRLTWFGVRGKLAAIGLKQTDPPAGKNG